MLSGRTLKSILVPLCASLVFLIGYFRDLLLLAVRSTSFVPFGDSAVSFHTEPDSALVSSESPLGLSSHLYRTDGILEVNAGGPHPILELIDRAEFEWNQKLTRASKTLVQAVAEYRRRYLRAPPKGFDVWWRYSEEHNVQLPDEYDQIWKDLEPFWGIDPSDLQRLQAVQEAHSDSFTLGKDELSGVKIVNTSFSDPANWEEKHLLRGAQDLVNLLRSIEHLLPPFRAVFSPHDNPNLLSDYGAKKMALDAAAKRSYIDIDKIPPAERLGWVSACASSSPARHSHTNTTSAALSSPRNESFIFDHRLTMDPCLHPQLLSIHGQFLAYGSGPSPNTMVPQFAYCSTTLHHDIRTPSLLSWVEDVVPRSDDPEWDDKRDERLSWRGSNTGMWHAPESPWRQAHRARLVSSVDDLNGAVRVLVPPLTEGARVGEGVNITKSKINPAMMDIAFAGAPLGCVPSVCEELSRIYEWRRRQGPKEAGNFKYVLDVDGNGWSSRFKRLITSNSLIFKATIYPEWFSERIQPWVHYIPVQVNYSDLYDALIFFRGGMYGEGAHEDLARRIARAGRSWSKAYWRKEDMTAYLFRLILEYSRVMSLDRDAMSYPL